MNPRILVLGWGNPGRLDDGLGPALVRELTGLTPADQVTLEAGYQLQIEDAALVAAHDIVIFVDAHRDGAEPFEFARVEPRWEASFTTHAVAPGAVLALAREHFGARTEAFVLGIRGVEFDGFGETLSPRAERNLGAAVDFLHHVLSDARRVREIAAGADEER